MDKDKNIFDGTLEDSEELLASDLAGHHCDNDPDDPDDALLTYSDKVLFEPQKYYRGMPMLMPNGITLYMSARDIGNMMAGYKAGASGLKWSDVENAFDMYQSRSIHVIQHEGFSTKNAEKYGYMLGRHSLPKHGRDKIINFAALFSSLFSH